MRTIPQWLPLRRSDFVGAEPYGDETIELLPRGSDGCVSALEVWGRGDHHRLMPEIRVLVVDRSPSAKMCRLEDNGRHAESAAQLYERGADADYDVECGKQSRSMFEVVAQIDVIGKHDSPAELLYEVGPLRQGHVVLEAYERHGVVE